MTPAQAELPVVEKYFELVRAFPLRPIRTDEENDRAIEVALNLSRSEEAGDLAPEERDHLDVLVSLIEQFEAVHHPIPEPTGLGMLHHLIDARQAPVDAVARAAGLSGSDFSEILAGRSPLGSDAARLLAAHLVVEVDDLPREDPEGMPSGARPASAGDPA